MNTAITHRQLIKLLELLDQKRITPDRFTNILSSGALADICDQEADLGYRHEVREALRLDRIFKEPFSLVIDYGLGLKEMVLQSGVEQSWALPDTVFSGGTGKVELESKIFDQLGFDMAGAVVHKITAADSRRPWQPARIEHLLAFAAAFPAEPQRKKIIALTSLHKTDDGHTWACFLFRSGPERKRMVGLLNSWDSSDRFLAVRAKESTPCARAATKMR